MLLDNFVRAVNEEKAKMQEEMVRRGIRAVPACIFCL